MQRIRNSYYIARDMDGTLYLYEGKPELTGSMWSAPHRFMMLDSKDYPECTYYNSPIEVTINIKEQ